MLKSKLTPEAMNWIKLRMKVLKDLRRGAGTAFRRGFGNHPRPGQAPRRECAELESSFVIRVVEWSCARALSRAMTSVFNNLRLAGYGATRRTATRARETKP